jgi:hypothetical protein
MFSQNKFERKWKLCQILLEELREVTKYQDSPSLEIVTELGALQTETRSATNLTETLERQFINGTQFKRRKICSIIC